MRIQVLVATMNQIDYSLLEKMRIDSDVIVGNQCNRNSIEQIDYKHHKAIYLNFAERGVGLNRNNALMRADREICLFADDDMIYVDHYADLVEKAFNEHQKADIIVFNLKEKIPKRYIIRKARKVGYLNYLRYGTARIAIRLSKVREKGIYFNQCYGGGTEHCHGEDSIFLANCLKAGLKIYAVPVTIAALTEERESTWENGYDDKYLKDQGDLYRAISPKWWRLLCLQDAVRKSKKVYEMSWRRAFRIMLKKNDL